MPNTDQSRQQPLVVVERWRRYGHDRAYVRVDGTDVGYRDLKTGELRCSQTDHAHLITEATDRLVHVEPSVESPAYVGRHAAEREATTPASADTGAVRLPRDPILRPDEDLALRQPGSAARSAAVAMKEAAPVLTFLSRVVGLKTEERSWRIGADAEEEVARCLQKLGPRWRALHAIPVGDQGSDIDHLVIGPAGVFTVNTKHHPDANVWVRGDTFKVNSFNHPYVRNSRHEAQRAARYLSARALFDVDVRGVIAVMGAQKGFTVKSQPGDGRVTVVTRRALAKHLSELPEVLSEPSMERIFAVARHLATWQPTSVQWQDLPT